MDWFAALLNRANGNAGVTAAIGAANKVYPEEAPQGTARPYVTILDLTPGRTDLLDGTPDLEASRVQIDVWANTYSQKNAIMAAVLAALLPGGTFNGHIFQRAIIDIGPRDVAGERDGTTPVRRKHADLIVHHTTA